MLYMMHYINNINESNFVNIHLFMTNLKIQQGTNIFLRNMCIVSSLSAAHAILY